jgi:hypothetical protein
MCDEDSLNSQNILQAVPRRDLKIVLQKAEYIFPALKDSLVSVLYHRKKQTFWDGSQHRIVYRE